MAYTTIDKPTDYFNTKLYTGNASTQSITGVGFQPDWIWIKVRNYDNGHQLFDSVRGTTKRLQSDTSGAEATRSSSITSFDSDGFSMGADAQINDTSSYNYVAWNWLASNTTASNTDGSITSTVSTNTTAGFSVGTFTKSGDTTVGHGLGSTPSLIITRHRNQASDWRVWHSSFGANEYINLNSTSAKATSTTIWQNTLPTSSVFSMGSLFDNVASVFYAFCEKKGYSKFGTYTGNGNADGTFVYTGFKPAWLMIKPLATASWRIWDNKREDYNGNVNQTTLNANENGVEYDDSSVAIDFLSNGFKGRSSNSDISGSGVSYIFMAFAENPFVSSGGIPCTAR